MIPYGWFILISWIVMIAFPLIMGLITKDDTYITLFCVMSFFGWLPGVIVVTADIETTENIIEKEIDIWHTDAPFGTYWVETSGSGNFIYYQQSSILRESYTVKILIGNKVKTHHYTTEEIDVYLTDDNTSMYLQYQIIEKTKEGNVFDYHYCTSKKQNFEIHVPNPNLYGE